MKPFSCLQRKPQPLPKGRKNRALEELTAAEMKLIQGAASNDTNESIYQSYAWLVENRRIQPLGMKVGFLDEEISQTSNVECKVYVN